MARIITTSGTVICDSRRVDILRDIDTARQTTGYIETYHRKWRRVNPAKFGEDTHETIRISINIRYIVMVEED